MLSACAMRGIWLGLVVELGNLDSAPIGAHSVPRGPMSNVDAAAFAAAVVDKEASDVESTLGGPVPSDAAGIAKAISDNCALYVTDPQIRHFVEPDDVRFRPLPLVVQDFLQAAVQPVKFGVWAEIGRAWAILDTRVIVWDYRQDGHILELPTAAVCKPGRTEEFALDQHICCVGLVPPRPGAFDGKVKVSNGFVNAQVAVVCRNHGCLYAMTQAPRACRAGMGVQCWPAPSKPEKGQVGQLPRRFGADQPSDWANPSLFRDHIKPAGRFSHNCCAFGPVVGVDCTSLARHARLPPSLPDPCSYPFASHINDHAWFKGCHLVLLHL